MRAGTRRRSVYRQQHTLIEHFTYIRFVNSMMQDWSQSQCHGHWLWERNIVRFRSWFKETGQVYESGSKLEHLDARSERDVWVIQISLLQ